MFRWLPVRFTLPLVLLFAASIVSSAAVQNRIASVNPTSRIAVPHTIPHRATNGTDLGLAPGNLKLDSLTLTFSMTDAQQAALTQLLIDLQNPSSPLYHQWLTPEQFGAQFGLSAPDLAKVSTWLTSQGFTITATARSSNYITFSGTVAQAQQAFGTQIHSLLAEGEAHISNLTDPTLPAGIAGVVTNISGLNDFKLKVRTRTSTVKLPAADTSGLHPQFTSSLTGTHYIAPGDFYTIYNVTPLISSSVNGQGVSIAVMGQTDIILTDVTAFRTASGLCTVVNATTCPNPLPTVRLFGSDPGTSQGDLPEASLDVEWAGAAAPNANIIYVNSTNVITGSLYNAISNNLAPIISISYGDCEANFGASLLTAINQALQQANAQGQTVVGPTGDAGATDCDAFSYPAVGGLAVDYPASSPFATAAGGSMFNEGNATGATAFWGSGNNANGGSAVGYIPETVWNETSSTLGLGAGGGGTSYFFPKPYWQVGATVPQDSSRDVPDIALNSASNHDGTLYCVAGSCVNGTFRASDGQSLTVVGGTSVAAPTLSGLLALVEQHIGSRIGNAGPNIYALAGSTYSANVFHDITTGNNTSPCVAGTPNCPAGGNIGFSAGPGYDLATGWGSVNAFNLVTYWNQVAPIGGGGGTGQIISTTSISTTSPGCGVAGGSLALTITVAKLGSGPTPTGTVQLLVDNVPSGSPIALNSGTASLTFSTAGLTSGGHNISAVYSGDATYLPSKGYLTADVVSSSLPDFSFTPCSGTVSAISGSASNAMVLTVTAVNGFTGPVTFNATSLDNVSATFGFTPTNVTTNGTTSFVMYAYQPNAITTTGHTRLRAANVPPNFLPRAPWYAAGSGAVLASALLLVLPRRRRWSSLLAVVLSVTALGAIVGCGQSTSTSGGSNNGGGTNTNAIPGTYSILVTASGNTTSGVVTHSSTVTFIVH